MKASIIAIAIVVSMSAFGAGDRYPGADPARSPDRHWLVSYVPATNEQSHVLFLGNMRDSRAKTKPLLAFNRSCDVLWSQDSLRLALTDWGGSDFSEIVIVQIDEKIVSEALDVRDIRQMKMAPEEISGHCYYEAARWLGQDELEIHVFGHANEAPLHGFDYWFTVSLPSGKAKLLRKKPD